MQQAAARRPGRKPRVSREQVLDAALAVADEGGLSAITMASVGARLGVEAMSLYRHIGNKEEMLDGLVDRVFAEIELPQEADAGATRCAGAPSRHTTRCGATRGRSG